MSRIEVKEVWCDKCDEDVTPKLKEWESRKAIIRDYECSRCGEILLRIPRDITFKPPEPPVEPKPSSGRLLTDEKSALPLPPSTKTKYISVEDHQARIEALIEEKEQISHKMLEYLRNYVRQWEKKNIDPTFGCIWDMIKMLGKEEFPSLKVTHCKGGE